MVKRKKQNLRQPLINIEKRIDNSITLISNDVLMSLQYDLIDNLKKTKDEVAELKKLLKVKEV